MPDNTFKTVSASELAALFDQSPYTTRWMLYQRFKNHTPIDPEEHSRMTWGKKMQPLLLEHVADELRFEVQANNFDHFETRNQIGCTRDAVITCPDRGPGALETKCVFDYGVWMRSWDGGKRPPVHYEIQLQAQMFVGDQEGKSYDWGVLAAWVCGEMEYFERKPDERLWKEMEWRAAQFFSDVEKGNEPNPLGAVVEVPLLNELYPAVARKTLESEDLEMMEDARLYKWAQGEKSRFTKLEGTLKAKLVAFCKDHDVVQFPEGVFIDIKKSQSKPTVITADMVGKVARKASVRTTLKVSSPKEE